MQLGKDETSILVLAHRLWCQFI